MSANYPGIAAPTVSIIPTTAAPGVIVSTGPTDALGWFPSPNVPTGNDGVTSASVAAPDEAMRDSINWLAQHSIDLARGGNWSTWTATVTFGNVVNWKGLQTFEGNTAFQELCEINPGATLQLDSGSFLAGAAEVATGTFAITGGTNVTPLTVTGNGNGTAAELTGGSSGAGAGFSSGGGGAPAAIARNGPVRFGQSIASSSTAPGVGCCWPQSFDMASGNISSDGAGGYTINRGLNIASVTRALFAGTQPCFRITFTQAMTSSDYATTVTPMTSLYLPVVYDQTATYVEFGWANYSGSSQDPASVAIRFGFRVSLD